MGVSKFLQNLSKPFLKCSQDSLHGITPNAPNSSALATLNPSKTHILTHYLNPSGFTSYPHFPRAFHDHTSLKTNNYKNLDAETTQEAERIAKLVSNVKIPKNLDSALSSANFSSISPIVVLEVLKKLNNAGITALAFFRWAEKQKGFLYIDECYNSLIEALGKIKQFKMVWVLVDEMKQKGLLSKNTFALVSRRYARARKVKEAMEAFEMMEKKYGFTTELQDYNRLLDTMSKSRHVDSAQKVFDKLKNRKFRPDIKSYAILLEGWGQECNLLRMDEVYREMRGDGFEPDVVTYGILINAYCKVRRFNEAIELYHEMEKKNIKTTPHIYCTLINGLGPEKRLNECLKFFESCKASSFAIEAPTYNAMVGAYCWSDRMHDAYRTVDEMKKCGVGPNARTYDIILRHLIKVNRTKEAYVVFNKISDEPGCEPTVSTYEIMVRMFCNEERTDMALRMWNQMKARGVLPGMHMFSTLINSLCNENKLNDACQYLQEMLDMGIRPPDTMFKTLKRALVDDGKEDIAMILTHKVERLRKTPLVG